MLGRVMDIFLSIKLSGDLFLAMQQWISEVHKARAISWMFSPTISTNGGGYYAVKYNTWGMAAICEPQVERTGISNCSSSTARQTTILTF